MSKINNECLNMCPGNVYEHIIDNEHVTISTKIINKKTTKVPHKV